MAPMEQKIKSLFHHRKSSKDHGHHTPSPEATPSKSSKPLPHLPSAAKSNQAASLQPLPRNEGFARATDQIGSQLQHENEVDQARQVPQDAVGQHSPTSPNTSGRSRAAVPASHGKSELPPIDHVDDLSNDLRHTSLGGGHHTQPNRQRYSEEVADRNIGMAVSNDTALGNTSETAGREPYNTGHTGRQQVASNKDVHDFGTNGHGQQQAGWEEDDLSRSPTSQKSNRDSAMLRRKPVGSGVEAAELQPERRTSIEQSEPISLEGVVDLTNTADTDVRERWAPAVTHETVVPQIHRVREERIHREIHNHTYLHRVQPVLDFEVLPARHFIPNPSGEGVVEVMEDQLPDCTGENQKWLISEKRATTLHNGKHPNGAQPLVGLDLDGHDEKRSVGPGGFERIETTWVYPPTLEDPSKLRGPTHPVHFGECGEECATQPNVHSK